MDLWPQAAYAEDQRLARTILTTHVLYRGFQSGALVGTLVGAARLGLQARAPRSLPASSAPAQAAATAATSSTTTTSPSSTPIKPATPSAAPSRALRLLRPAGTGAAAGTLLMTLAVAGRMRGRAEIEWQDRAWRLLQNEGQVSVDRWSVVGGAVGAAAAAVGARGVVARDWRLALGAAGWGSLVGVGGSMGFRMLV